MSETTMRLFTALELPEPVRVGLADWTEARLAERVGLRGLSAESLHVTLCFLGTQPTDAVEPISAACAALAGRGDVELETGEPLWLPRRRPRVLAVELTDVTGALAAMQSELAARLSDGGWYPREQRRFLPHVTVARAGRRQDPRAAALDPLPPAPGFRAGTVSLMRSRPGSRYERLASVALGE